MSRKNLRLTQLAAGFIRYKTATGHSRHTLANYKRTFQKLHRYLGEIHGDPDPPVGQITRDHLVGFLAWLQNDYISEPAGIAPRDPIRLSPKTVRNIHTELSAFWTWLVDEDLVDHHLVRAIDAPKARPPVIVPFTKEEVAALLKACHHSRPWRTRPHLSHNCPHALRNQTIILLLLDTGLRASELCAVRLCHLDLTVNTIKIRGKGYKERLVYFGQRTGKHLWKYLIPRLDQMPPDQRLLLVGPDDDPRPMTRQNLRRCLKRIGQRAGVPDVYPHRFRHTFALTYLRNGGDIITLQALLGHSDLTMVRRYLRIVQTDLEDAHRRASPVDNWRL